MSADDVWMQFRIVTLNTWKCDGDYAARLATMARGIAALAPDVVALQEAFAAPEAGHDTAACLARALSMAVTSLPLRRKYRALGGRSLSSTSGLAILSPSPARAQRSVFVTDDPRDGERAALIAECAIANRVVTLACLHLTHLDGEDELRRRQWREIEVALAQAKPAIVAGDFNAPIETFGLGTSRFADSRQACGEPARPTTDEPAVGCIDHVLFSRDGGLRPLRWTTALTEPGTTGVAASDHRAVVVDFTVG